MHVGGTEVGTFGGLNGGGGTIGMIGCCDVGPFVPGISTIGLIGTITGAGGGGSTVIGSEPNGIGGKNA